jgi:predicted HD phosphohydrolase
VAAKKYLCALDGEYFAHLSAASVQSLQVQGGPMTETEIEAFESSPYHQAAVQLRHYDDDGKVAGLDIKPVQSYQNMLQSVLKP